MLQPQLPDYDLATWRTLPFPERLRLVCQAWAVQGYGTPGAIFGLYAVKIALYVLAWLWFCTFTDGVTLAAFGEVWATRDVFFKLMLWTMLYEVLGFGCGNGPLAGRYLPPTAGALYFLRPGTIKLPFLPGLPLVGGTSRTWLDVGLYAAQLGLLLRALTAPALGVEHLLPLAVLPWLIGLSDKTVFLAMRPEHYLSLLVCALLSGDWIVGSKWVWLAIWWWAATSKLNLHFPAVMCVMVSNAPWTGYVPGLRQAMYRHYPDDLRPSRFAATLTHSGTFLEYAFPAAILAGGGGPLTQAALVVMVVFHLFILVNVPMGVPLEWNLVMIYGGLVLFGAHSDVSMLQISSPALVVWLLAVHLLLPIVGSTWPHAVSFLLSMRYYAGNWAYSVWLFDGDAERKLDGKVIGSSASLPDQLGRLYPDDTVTALLSKVVAFRCMHLHGRALHHLLPLSGVDLDRAQWRDGEVIAGRALGWNFGDGHLHHEQLLAALQERCQFAPGELRCIFVESQPWFRRTLAYRIVDAHTGELARGELPVRALTALQPWGATAAP
jgi:hypothetical protein